MIDARDNTTANAPPRAKVELVWQKRKEFVDAEMPSLKGIKLMRAKETIPFTWLDRANSLIAYRQALNYRGRPLLMAQPSVLVSPVYPLIALMSLSVDDAVTSTRSAIEALKSGMVYEIDGFYCRYCGPSNLVPGWLHVQFKGGGSIHNPPFIAKRMRPAPGHLLSKGGGFTSKPKVPVKEPIEKFFDLPYPVGVNSLDEKVLFVTSRQRADNLLGSVSSHQLDLTASGLVGFRGSEIALNETPLTNPITVVPTIALVRRILESGEQISAVLVDGYERMVRGRHDLPFIRAMQRVPSLIIWDFKGYLPLHGQGVIGDHEMVAVSSTDLKELLAADDRLPGKATKLHRSLELAANPPTLEEIIVGVDQIERELVEALDAFIEQLKAPDVPDFWRYQLRAAARRLRTIVVDTPAYWADVQRYAGDWQTSFRDQWSKLNRRGAEVLAPLRDAHNRVIAACEKAGLAKNAKAAGLEELLKKRPDVSIRLPCEIQEQVTIAAAFVRNMSRLVEPVMLGRLPVNSDCAVIGWPGSTFARKLWAHTPKSIVAIVDQHQANRWNKSTQHAIDGSGLSLVAALDNVISISREIEVTPGEEEDGLSSELEFTIGEELFQDRMPCVFVWPRGEANGQVIARQGLVLTEAGDNVAARQACDLAPGDKAVLSRGSSRWSPSDEFTEALVRGIEESHPELVSDAKAWRRGLHALLKQLNWSIWSLGEKLRGVGIVRDRLTIDGWLKLDRAAPIGPRHIRSDLTAMWPIIGDLAGASLEAAISASTRLRSLRSTAGRALIKSWKGQRVDFGVDREWIADLVTKLREQVEVFEIERITFGEVPEVMLGWWVPAETAKRFELEWNRSRPLNAAAELVLAEEDD